MSQVDFQPIIFHNMGNVIPSPVYEKVWALQYLYFWVIRLGQCIVMDAICNVTFEGMRKVGAETVREQRCLILLPPSSCSQFSTVSDIRSIRSQSVSSSLHPPSSPALSHTLNIGLIDWNSPSSIKTTPSFSTMGQNFWPRSPGTGPLDQRVIKSIKPIWEKFISIIVQSSLTYCQTYLYYSPKCHIQYCPTAQLAANRTKLAKLPWLPR